MNRTKFLAGLCLTVFLAAVPAFAQSDAKPKEPQKPALTGSAAILEQWNDVGRKLIAIAEDLPEDKYDYNPSGFADVRRQLAACFGFDVFFHGYGTGKKARYDDDPKRDELKTKAQVVRS